MTTIPEFNHAALSRDQLAQATRQAQAAGRALPRPARRRPGRAGRPARPGPRHRAVRLPRRPAVPAAPAGRRHVQAQAAVTFPQLTGMSHPVSHRRVGMGAPSRREGRAVATPHTVVSPPPRWPGKFP